jgi:hypothetical protein
LISARIGARCAGLPADIQMPFGHEGSTFRPADLAVRYVRAVDGNGRVPERRSIPFEDDGGVPRWQTWVFVAAMVVGTVLVVAVFGGVLLWLVGPINWGWVAALALGFFAVVAAVVYAADRI